ncbi:MAG: hypothetical protein EOP50_06850 [Sphingobacteriales bacterium]|nr:MAG: hypothetical protein EOP50_06850 [Sphingobacteriales bacterium]
MYRYIFDFSEQPWDDEPHRIGYFLQEAQRKQNKDLGSFAICYTGYNAQIQFYVHDLNARNIPITLKSGFQGLWIGEHLLVCQDQWRREAENLGFTRVDDRFGCTEYIVTKVP